MKYKVLNDGKTLKYLQNSNGCGSSYITNSKLNDIWIKSYSNEINLPMPGKFNDL